VPSLGADTVVVLEGKIFGKPVSRADARSMLQRLSGQTHRVYSAVALATGGKQVSDRLSVTAVTFAALPPAWIRQYCDRGEPMDKAGAYAIQGVAGRFIERIDGSYSGVMGLPLFETAELLAQAGLLD
jgi:septum formation protein